jgi:hypothetical protein
MENQFTILLCWNCGYYESDSPAYLSSPELFRDIVRKNPKQFMRNFLKVIPADEFSQRKRTDGDFTESWSDIYVDLELGLKPRFGGKRVFGDPISSVIHSVVFPRTDIFGAKVWRNFSSACWKRYRSG